MLIGNIVGDGYGGLGGPITLHYGRVVDYKCTKCFKKVKGRLLPLR